MKRIFSVFLLTLMLQGCTSGQNTIDRGIALRESIASSKGCEFEATVVADYGDDIYTFRMQCNLTEDSSVQFTVLEPETISGISGQIDSRGGKLVFDDTILAFPPIADGQLTPVSAPWVIMNALRSGYIHFCGNEGEGIRIRIHDSYQDEALTVDIWTDEQDIPVRGEILWENRRIMSVDIKNFHIM